VNLQYLLDTNTVSHLFRAQRDSALLERVRAAEGRVATAAPVWHELRYGCGLLPRSARRDALDRFLIDVVLRNFPILDYARPAAEWHASERVRLGRGNMPPFVDGQIAAIAFVNGLTLVTENLADFRSFERLQVENWHSRS
jgi:tRNA(fMet)-specific endonuclease VapC